MICRTSRQFERMALQKRSINYRFLLIGSIRFLSGRLIILRQ